MFEKLAIYCGLFRFTPLTDPNAHKVLALENPVERLKKSQTNGDNLFIYIWEQTGISSSDVFNSADVILLLTRMQPHNMIVLF